MARAVDKDQRTLSPQINLQARLVFEFVHELGIHARARVGERRKGRWHFEREVGEHSSGGPGGLAPRLTLIYYQHAQATLVQIDGQGKADDSRPYDNCVPAFHYPILAAHYHRPSTSNAIDSILHLTNNSLTVKTT